MQLLQYDSEDMKSYGQNMSHNSSDSEPNATSDNESRGTVPGYRLITHYARHIKKFKTDKYITRFILEDGVDLPPERLMNIFDELIDQAIDKSKEHYDSQGYEPYKFQVHLFGEILDTPISISLRERDRESDADELMNEIEKLDVSI